MKIEELFNEIKLKKSFLCVGLDVDLNKIPPHLLSLKDPVFEFNKAIIDATHHLCVAYKPNMAFYESYGYKGWKSLEKTISYINKNYPKIFTIADAKRCDIGNTASMYAKAFFKKLNFNAMTVSPYMGRDSIEPFLAFKNKYTVMLALTSNESAYDFQTKNIGDKRLYEKVIEDSKSWKNSKNIMYVVGATKSEYFKKIRKIVPNAFLLVPGIGEQGGSLKEVCKHGLSEKVGLLINLSRGIIYAKNNREFANEAKVRAEEIQRRMAEILKDFINV